MSDLGSRIKRVEMAEERLKTQNSTASNNANFALKKSSTLKGDL